MDLKLRKVLFDSTSESRFCEVEIPGNLLSFLVTVSRVI
jgi:hypothetical protein